MDKNMDKNIDVQSRGVGKSRIYINFQAASGDILRFTAESTSCGLTAGVVRL
jgi:hypothetical protein